MPSQKTSQKRPQDELARLDRAFFARPATVVARDVLGARLIRLEANGERLSGWITEAEAYSGAQDLASHARHGRTQRNAAMWEEPGHAYVYFTYGMHWMLNLVTEQDGQAGAVLVRGMLPYEGLATIRRRRKRPDSHLTDGPAKLCQALGIDGAFDGLDLCGPDANLYLCRGVDVPNRIVTIGPRVGLNHVPEPWFSQPWRFQVSAQSMTNLLEKASEA